MKMFRTKYFALSFYSYPCIDSLFLIDLQKQFEKAETTMLEIIILPSIKIQMS